ncbi:carbohydrate binding domain-containing protein [bacterium]|nr:carbohydrate binding domain-containing protein [bacterium]
MRFLLALFLLGWLPLTMGANLVLNGGFEEDNDRDGVPDFWSTAGAPTIKQAIYTDTGKNGIGKSGKLSCWEFGDGTPASHAMICQVGTVGVVKGKWYRLSFWAKGKDIRTGLVRVALVDTRIWNDVGLQDSFFPTTNWQKFEFYFQANNTLQARDSRLQIWFNSTGMLWLDDVELVEIPSLNPQRYPQIPVEGVKNLLPNSSFECGTSGWGSYSPDIFWWEGNVFQFIGEIDSTTAVHGKSSLKLSASLAKKLTFYFDYFDPVRQQVKSLLVANQGWIPVQPGETYTLSTYLKSSQPQIEGILFVKQSDGRSLRKNYKLTSQWQRYSFTFSPQSDFIWIGVGFTIPNENDTCIWVDAVQLEKGEKPTEYKPRREVEIGLSTNKPGNIFITESDKPILSLLLNAFADKGEKGNIEKVKKAKAKIIVSDFQDKEVFNQIINLEVQPGKGIKKLLNFPLGKLGFYRIKLQSDDYVQTLRCAIIRPFKYKDSRWGMNHAYPWQFLLRLAHQAGILWWRDWSVQWRIVQPNQNKEFDFTESDAQIKRVVEENGKVLVLFPFPSAEWSSSGDIEEIRRKEPVEYRQKEMLLACKPRYEEAFVKYIKESVRHYRNFINAYHIFNEPLFTSYSLPASLGYTIDDYLDLLGKAYKTIKENQPDAIVVGGIGTWADSQWTHQFVEKGGLQWVDALDLHLYGGGSPEGICESLLWLKRKMAELKQIRPIWLTELGCYADDDPPVLPFRTFFGDSAMRSSLHPDELSATIWLVKFATIFFSQGGEKIFLHAGICGEINGIDAGSVFFEFGGTPRKLYPAISAMANFIPPDAKFVREEEKGGIKIYWFIAKERLIGVAWSPDGNTHKLKSEAGFKFFDIMGNPISTKTIELGEIPVYIIKEEKK